MTPREIKAFATKTNMDAAYSGKRVRVKAPEKLGGKYLGYSGQFDAEKDEAVVYDYTRHKVGDQIYALMLNDMPIEVELAD
jgi:hypothetical protein